MIRWDPVGEHIIVECLEQLALHVLSVHHQLRFASFSRQLHVSPYFYRLYAALSSPSRFPAYGWRDVHR